MKKSMKPGTLVLIFAFAAATFVSCKDKETMVDETTTETSVETDTTAVPIMETPADTTTTGAATETPVAQ